jgi:hypothetical protein
MRVFGVGAQLVSTPQETGIQQCLAWLYRRLSGTSFIFARMSRLLLACIVSLPCAASLLTTLGRVPNSVPRPRRRASLACTADATLEIFLFDPRSDELPFPFPAPRPAKALQDDLTRPPSTSRYAFDRSIHLRMLRDALDDMSQPSALPSTSSRTPEQQGGEGVHPTGRPLRSPHRR